MGRLADLMFAIWGIMLVILFVFVFVPLTKIAMDLTTYVTFAMSVAIWLTAMVSYFSLLESRDMRRINQQTLDAMIKGVERPKIIELSKNVLGPFLNLLKMVDESHLPRELNIWGDAGLLNDLERRRLGIKKLVEIHNKDSKDLSASIDNLINNQEFKKECQELINTYNETAQQNERLIESQIPFIMNRVAYQLIQNKKDFVEREDWPDRAWERFWITYGDELLRMREKDDILDIIRKSDVLLDSYVINSRKLQEELIQLKEKWVSEFNLLREEIQFEAGV